MSENGLPGTNQGLSTVKPRHGHTVCTLQMHPPTPPYSAHTDPFSKGHALLEVT